MTLPLIKHPNFDATIPSTKQLIRIRPMLTAEEKLLLIAKESTDQTDMISAIKTVVTNCIVTAAIDVDALAIFDIEYLMVRIRAISVSHIAKTAGYHDNEDDKDYPIDIDLDKVIVKFADPLPDSQIIIANADSDDVTVTLQYPSAKLYSDKNFLSATGQAMNDILVQNCIQSVGTDDSSTTKFADVPPTEQLTFINSLPLKVYDQIREWIANLPTVYYKVVYTNSKGSVRQIELTSLGDFFSL